MQPTASSTAPTTSAVGLRYGLLMGLVSVVFWFAIYATSQEMNTALTSVGLLVPVVGIVLAQRYFRGQNGGFMSYGQGLGIGLFASLVSSALTTAFNYLYRTIIDPEQPARMMEAMRAKFEAQGQMSDEQIEQAVRMSQKFSQGPIGIVTGLIFGLVIGLIISLIVSAFLKHNRPEFE